MTRTPLSRSKNAQPVADVLNSQHTGTGATWRINTKILSTCRGRRHIVSPRAQLVNIVELHWCLGYAGQAVWQCVGTIVLDGYHRSKVCYGITVSS